MDGEITYDEAGVEKLLRKVRALREENERLKESTAAPGSNDEWMRLFGVVWYSETYHQRHVGEIKHERDEAVRLLSDILSSEEDIDPRMRYVTCQIDRETLAQCKALIKNHQP